MIEYEQISPNVINVIGVYECDVRLKLRTICTDFDEPLFDGVNAEELEQIAAKMKELQEVKSEKNDNN